jgi:two-component system nitrate/nitrite response regulator NarL
LPRGDGQAGELPARQALTAPPGRRLRVLLVGDDALARSGLAALLAGEPSIAIVGQLDAPTAFAGAEEAGDPPHGGEAGAAPGAPREPRETRDSLEPLEPLEPLKMVAAHDVAIWDLGPHPAAGLESFERAGGAGPQDRGLALDLEAAPPVLALLASEAPAADLLAAGVRGLLLRDAEPSRMEAAVAALAQGMLVIDEALAPRLLRQRPAAPALAEPLTARELEVLDLLAQGLSNKQIGARLSISEHTAKFHVNAIVGKLGAQGRTDAAMRGARLGLVVL